VSKHLTTVLLRFSLVGLLAVARLFCPCPSAEAESVVRPDGRSAHSCCDETKSGQRDADHSNQGGCENCPDAPQFKPPAVAGDELALAAHLQSHPLPTFAADTSTPPTALQLRIPPEAAHPPLTLVSLRTVVLLI
jgi:hypothetical protein